MEKYVLALTTENGVQLGLDELSKDEAQAKINQYKMIGVDNVEMINVEDL